MQADVTHPVVPHFLFQDIVSRIGIEHLSLDGRGFGRFRIVDQVQRPPDLVILLRVEFFGAVGHHQGVILDIGRAPGHLPPHLALEFPVAGPGICVQDLGRDRDADQGHQGQPAEARLEHKQDPSNEQHNPWNGMQPITLIGVKQLDMPAGKNDWGHREDNN